MRIPRYLLNASLLNPVSAKWLPLSTRRLFQSHLPGFMRSFAFIRLASDPKHRLPRRRQAIIYFLLASFGFASGAIFTYWQSKPEDFF